jgi:hypothetical protein
MENVDLANAMVAAALIQSGQVKLSEFNERGEPIHGRDSDHRSQAERFMRQAEVLGDPDFDSFSSPALTNAIRRALYKLPAQPPRASS